MTPEISASHLAAPSSKVLISVVTPTYNCTAKIDATVQSVLAQRGGAWEHLLIDGGSTDGTLQRIYSYAAKVRWISEPDAGIYDAMNKGIRMAQGRFLYFLGAGDCLRAGVLEAVAAEIAKLPLQEKNAKPALLYGNVNWSRYRRPYDGRFNRFKLLRRNICHQAIFYQRSVFEQLGFYNTKYRLLADYEFNIRCFNDRGIAKRYIPLLIADYEGGGESNTTADLAFHADFRRMAHQQCGAGDALLMRLAFLLAHPRALIREPSRQIQRLLRAKF